MSSQTPKKSSFAYRDWKMTSKDGSEMVEFPMFDESSELIITHQRFHHVCDELLLQRHHVLLRVRGNNVVVRLHEKDKGGKVLSVFARDKSYSFSKYSDQVQLWKALNNGDASASADADAAASTVSSHSDASASAAAAASTVPRRALVRPDAPICMEWFSTLGDAQVTPHGNRPLEITTPSDDVAMEARPPAISMSDDVAMTSWNVNQFQVWIHKHDMRTRDECYSCVRACRRHVYVCRELANTWDARTIISAMTKVASLFEFDLDLFQNSPFPDVVQMLYRVQEMDDALLEESSDDGEDEKIAKQYCAKLRATTDKDTTSVALFHEPKDTTSVAREEEWWGVDQVRQAYTTLTRVKQRQTLLRLVSSVFFQGLEVIGLQCVVEEKKEDKANTMHQRPLRVHHRQGKDGSYPSELPMFQSPFSSVEWLEIQERNTREREEQKKRTSAPDYKSEDKEEHDQWFNACVREIKQYEKKLLLSNGRKKNEGCYVLYRPVERHERTGMYPRQNKDEEKLVLKQVNQIQTTLQRTLSKLQVVPYHPQPDPAAPPAHLQRYLPPFSPGHKSTTMQRYKRGGYVPEHVLGMSGALLQQLLRHTQHKLSTTPEESRVVHTLEASMQVQEHCRREHTVVKQEGASTTTHTIVEQRSRQMTLAPLLAEARKTRFHVERRQEWLNYLQRAMRSMTSALEEYHRSTIRQMDVLQSIRYAARDDDDDEEEEEEEDWYTALPPDLKEELLNELRLDSPVKVVQPDPNLDRQLMARIECDILNLHWPNSSFLTDYAHFHRANEDVCRAQNDLNRVLRDLEQGRELLMTD